MLGRLKINGQRLRLLMLGLALGANLVACDNSPHPMGAAKENTFYSAFDERTPRYLDPTASYSAPEAEYTYVIYESPYAYHWLKRPHTLVPRTVEAVVEPRYEDAQGHALPHDAPAEQIAFSVYELKVKPGIQFAPHPAFAKDAAGNYLYHHLTKAQLGDKRSPWNFEVQGTRELVAEDYVYAMKRQATTRIETPIFSTFSEYVLGLREYADLIKREDAKLTQGLSAESRDKPFLDFRRWPLEGAKALDKYTFQLRIKGKYPQWQYWFAMPFTSPMAWEADAFYAQPGMSGNGLSLNQWPVGTGPFMMKEYLRDRRTVMVRNPNFHGATYPCEGSEEDRKLGYLDDCGKALPFVDKIVSNNIKERSPTIELFKQGYLDVPSIWRPEWGMEFIARMEDSDELKKFYGERGFKFPRVTDINNWYLGFNWWDPVVGKGDTPEQQVRNRKLRQALSIAIDWEEGYGRIFRTKGGEAAQGLLPPGVFGSREKQADYFNPVTHRMVNGHKERRPIEDAKKLLAQAGYPGGRDAKTGKPLVLNYDYQRTLTPELKAEVDWMVKQFAKLDIQLEIRNTDYNQFQEKVLKGKHQIFWWGWLADYPDAENFLFLLYGPNSKSKVAGENTTNYENLEYDRLYRKLKTLDDGPEKQKTMDEMMRIAQEDAPMAFGYWAWVASAFQPWVYNGKPGIVQQDRAMYYRVDTAQRARTIPQWNHPIWWPLLLVLAGVLTLVWQVRRSVRQREQAVASPQTTSA